MTETNQSNIEAPLMEELVKSAFDILSDGEVTFSEIVHLGATLASKANRLERLSGFEKQKLVVKVVEVALQQLLELKLSSLSDADRDQFRQKVQLAADFAKETLPAVLDVAVSAARGEIDLRKPEVQKVCWASIVQLLRCAGFRAPVLPSKEVPQIKDQSASSADPVQAATEKKDPPSEPETKETETRTQESS